MTITDYIFDSALVLLVLWQIRERPLTNASLARPLVAVCGAIALFLKAFPTAGSDLVLILALAALGAAIGVASGLTVIVRPGPDGRVLARAGWAAGALWVLGMGSRFAFAWWATHGGGEAIGRFSIEHQISGAPAWTAALLMMALLEVCGRTLALCVRRAQVAGAPTVGVA
ncbi:MAG TPA: hypothetical protein VKV27_14305 [Solirubrobacteraceae bacterium]|nr:hypothetical protein [Solirubrobacteraceae bacterium]